MRPRRNEFPTKNRGADAIRPLEAAFMVDIRFFKCSAGACAVMVGRILSAKSTKRTEAPEDGVVHAATLGLATIILGLMNRP